LITENPLTLSISCNYDGRHINALIVSFSIGVRKLHNSRSNACDDCIRSKAYPSGFEASMD
jgi:hypothetical protein